MSDFKVNSITDRSGYCGPVIAGVSTNASSGCMIIPKGPTEHRGGRGRGVFGTGYNNAPNSSLNSLQFVTIATAGNTTDFGDLTAARYALTATANKTQGLFLNGREAGENYYIDTIESVTIASTGNATDFGNGVEGRRFSAATSSAHGGIA